MTSNFKLVTLAVLTTHQHSITRCSRTVAFHMNSNNNRSHVCSRLWMLLHLGKLLKADYRVKKQMFSEDLAHPNPPVWDRQYPKPQEQTKKKKKPHTESETSGHWVEIPMSMLASYGGTTDSMQQTEEQHWTMWLMRRRLLKTEIIHVSLLFSNTQNNIPIKNPQVLYT